VHEVADIGAHFAVRRQVHGHRVHHDLHGAEAGDGEPAQHGPALALLDFVPLVGIEGVGGVTNGGHRAQDVGQADPRIIPAHPRPVGGIVDVHRQHARKAAQVALIEPDTGRAGYALEDERGFPHVFPVLPHEAALHVGEVVKLEAIEKLRNGVARVFGERAAVAVIIVEAGLHDGVSHGLAPGAAHGAALAADDRRETGAGRHREAAMKAACDGVTVSAYRCWLFQGAHARPMLVQVRLVKTMNGSGEYRT